MMKTASKTQRSIRNFAMRAISSALLAEFSAQAAAITTLSSGGAQTVNSDSSYQVLTGTTITSSAGGVTVNGIAPVTFSNAGKLYSSGPNGGLTFNVAGTVTNQLGGIIGGTSYGVQMYGANDNLINYGDIYATSSKPVEYGVNATGTFDNYGTINAGTPAGSTADAVNINATGLVTVNNHAGASIKSGTGTAYDHGIMGSAGNSVVQNDGEILTSREAIYMNGAGTVTLTNSASGSITSRVTEALELQSGSTVNNFGLITTQSTTTPIILLSGNNNRVNLGTGSSLTGGNGVAINSTGTGNTVSLSGSGSLAGSLKGATTAGLQSLTAAAGSNWTLNGDIDLSGTAANTIDVQGNLTLGGAAINAASGSITIASGAVLTLTDGGTGGSYNGNIVNNGDLYYARGDDISVGSVTSGSGDWFQNGPGKLTLTAAQGYTGATTVNGGTLALGVTNALASSRRVEVVSGATLDLTNKAQSVHNLSGGGNVLLGSATLTDSVDVDGQFSGVISGTGSVTKTGSGILVLGGANTYTGRTTVSAGTLQIGDGDTSGSLKSDISNSGTVVFDRTDVSEYANAVTGSGAIIKQGSGTTILTGANDTTGAVTISAGTLQLGNGGNTGVLFNDISNNGKLVFNRSDGVVFSSDISGTGTVTQAGSGATVLTGTNTFTGDLLISNGVLQVGKFATTGSITANVIDNAEFTYGRSDDVTFGKIISGSGHFTQDGPGKLTLTGSNTYTGGTLINSGSLQIGAGGTSGSIVGNVVNNAALIFNRSDSVTYAGVVSGSGTLTQAGSGTLILTGDQTATGLTTISNGTLQLGAGGSTGSVAGDIANAGTLSINHSNAFVFAGGLSGTGTLNQDGSGITTLSKPPALARSISMRASWCSGRRASLTAPV